jgi:DNA-directed RNA polymerase specialized sigma24 family protein
MNGQLDRRTRRRLRFDSEARRQGAASGRWLEYVEHHHAESLEQFESGRPDSQMQPDEHVTTMERIRSAVARLEEDERRALSLRYDRNLSARQIASEMSLDNQRQAFTVLERAIRKLRRALGVPTEGSGRCDPGSNWRPSHERAPVDR